jgi:hypothetical protein
MAETSILGKGGTIMKPYGKQNLKGNALNAFT